MASARGSAVDATTQRPERRPSELRKPTAPSAPGRALQQLLRKGEERRRALLHIMVDMNDSNQRLADQRKAMLHILGDYENERRQLGRQTERLRNTRRALLHILQDAHRSNERLERAARR